MPKRRPVTIRTPMTRYPTTPKPMGLIYRIATSIEDAIKAGEDYPVELLFDPPQWKEVCESAGWHLQKPEGVIGASDGTRVTLRLRTEEDLAWARHLSGVCVCCGGDRHDSTYACFTCRMQAHYKSATLMSAVKEREAS